MSRKMDLEDNILFITGRLAENNLKKVIELIENKNFKYEVRNLGINVAALMTIDIIEKNIGDVEKFNVYRSTSQWRFRFSNGFVTAL